METLRHLLSFVYDRTTDSYTPITIWENPNDESDVVVMAKLASRPARKSEFEKIATTCNIVVGSNGHCQRDAVEATETMYSRLAGAMRTNFSKERPAQPIFFVDATGAALGRGLTHAEIGSADFDGNAKQSRSTLAPVAAYEGSDKGAPLCENLDLVLPSFNRMIIRGAIDRDGETIPARPMTAADMQGTKALYGKCSSSHATWCKCQPGIDSQHKYATEPVDSYADMCKYIDEEVGCEMLTFDEMSANGHYDPGVARGGRFVGFACACCGYTPSEKKWRADLAAFSRRRPTMSRWRIGRGTTRSASPSRSTRSTTISRSTCTRG